MSNLIITPQIILALQPDGSLTVEVPSKSGYRDKTVLTPGKVEEQLKQILYQRAADIEHERLLQAELRAKAARPRRQPDWRVIAKHPGVEIREIIQCPPGPGLSSNKSDKTLEEMGL